MKKRSPEVQEAAPGVSVSMLERNFALRNLADLYTDEARSRTIRGLFRTAFGRQRLEAEVAEEIAFNRQYEERSVYALMKPDALVEAGFDVADVMNEEVEVINSLRRAIGPRASTRKRGKIMAGLYGPENIQQ